VYTKFTFAFLILGHWIATALAQPSLSIDDQLRLDQIQLIGSHNSYKQAIDPPLLALLRQTDSAMADALDYSHVPLSEQLNMGLRNLELDLYADTRGGKYAQPLGLTWVKDHPQTTPYDPAQAMNAPGFKVLHVQEVDFRSNCLTLAACLEELRQWSEANPGHLPVFVTLNAKDDPVDRPGFATPEPFTAPVLDALDEEIREVLGEARILSPDAVRGNHKSLEEAVRQDGWPTLAEARGRFLFILDEVGDKRAAYVRDHPALRGRVMFANAAPGTPEAAWLIMNEAVENKQEIQQRVKEGYLVRTRADANTREARDNNTRTFRAAKQSGAQIITTDYYQKSTHFPSDYVVHFEDGSFVRRNPLK
jgi:hypothetical protein